MSAPSLPKDASLDELLALAGRHYQVAFEPVTVGEDTLEILQIADLEAVIDRLAATPGPIELPFWAKIWPTSLLLAHFIRHLGPGNGRTMLEIGAGVGVCGLFAAKRGFKVTLTDVSPEALLFTRINILKNGLADTAEAVHADFTSSRLERRFDFILGSEVLYMEDTYRGLLKFLLAHLAPTGAAEVVLAKDYHRKATKFMNMAAKEFAIAERVIGFKESAPGAGQAAERQLSQIYRMRLTKHV